MPDIFLSYSREDQDTAGRFAEGLERAGFSVWWDQTLRSGEAYDQVTEKALKEAKAVVVLWSKKSVDSRWVRAEATIADRNKTLVPVTIEPSDRPVMFELTQTADLSRWKGDANDKIWLAFVRDVRQFVERGGPVATAPPAASPASGAGRDKRMGLIAIALLALFIIVGGALWKFARTGVAPGAAAAATVPASTRGVVTLAVLPFADMSPAKDQEYFSDGLSEELLNQLAQIKALRLTARTSSFSFKGKNEDVRAIGKALGVANILEGSVRKDGNHLRITAQLINAADGTHLWSQTFNRELQDVFAVQEEIAMAVSGALSITLDVGEMSRAQGGTNNIAAYEKYLQALSVARQDGEQPLAQAAQLLREAVALDPAFSRAWVRLYGVLLTSISWLSESSIAEVRREMGDVAGRVETLAPEAWWTQVLRRDRFLLQRKWSEADVAARAAVAKASPSDSVCEEMFDVGRIEQDLPCEERARQADPLSLVRSMNTQWMLDLADRRDEAQAEYVRSRELAGDHRRPEHYALLRLMGRKDASPTAVKAQYREFLQHTGTFSMPLDRILFERLDDKAAARAAIRQAYEDPANLDRSRMLIITQYADVFGDTDLALAALRRETVEISSGLTSALWYPFMTGLRSDPRFKDIVRELGLVEYWRASGNWGDYCKPVGEDDFECH
jgi:TolB-like protein